MPRLRFTQTFLDSLADKDSRWEKALAKWRADDPKRRRGRTPQQRVELWDDALTGLGIWVRPSGKAGWQIFTRLDGRQVRDQLGSIELYPEISAARKSGQASLRKIMAGVDPVKEKRETKRIEETALGEMLADYLDHRPQKGAPEYLTEIRRALQRDVINTDLGTKSIGAVKREDIKAMLYDVAQQRPGHARHLHSYLSTAFAWLAEHRDQPNLMVGIKSPAPKVERDRALEEDDELRLFWLGCDKLDYPFGRLFQLLLLTGVRRDEIAESTWSEFNLGAELWKLPGSRTKNHLALDVHLSPLALDILASLPRMKSERGWLFPQQRQRNSRVPVTDNSVSGFGNAAKRLAAIMDKMAADEGLPAVEHFTRHDLRRSLATGMAKLGVRQEVVDRLLNNNTSGRGLSDVSRIYNRYSYTAERREALEAWAAKIESLVGIEREPAPANVIELAAARG
jgi:integrase